MDQLHRRGPLRRHRLQHRRRLLVRPRPAQPPRHALPLQRGSGRPAGPLRLPARPGDGRVLEPHVAAGPVRPRGLRVPPRRRLHAHPSTCHGIAAEITYFVPPSPPTSPSRASCGCSVSATPAPARASPAQLQLRRVQLLRRLQRHGQPRLGPAHRLQLVRGEASSGFGRSSSRSSTSSARARSRPATPAIARTSSAAAATWPTRSSSRRASPPTPVAARQQRGVADPRHRAGARRGAPDRLRHGRHGATGRDRPDRRPVQGPGRGRRRVRRSARRLGRLPLAFHGRRRPTPTRTRCSTSGTRSSAGPRSTGRASSPGTRPAWAAAWARATAARTLSGRCTPCRTMPAGC
jgi:hypothetical protein